MPPAVLDENAAVARRGCAKLARGEVLRINTDAIRVRNHVKPPFPPQDDYPGPGEWKPSDEAIDWQKYKYQSAPGSYCALFVDDILLSIKHTSKEKKEREAHTVSTHEPLRKTIGRTLVAEFHRSLFMDTDLLKNSISLLISSNIHLNHEPWSALDRGTPVPHGLTEFR